MGKSPDSGLLHEMIGFAAKRWMELTFGGLTKLPMAAKETMSRPPCTLRQMTAGPAAWIFDQPVGQPGNKQKNRNEPRGKSIAEQQRHSMQLSMLSCDLRPL